MSNESAESFENQRLLDMLKSSRENVNWEIVDERRKFIHQVYPLIGQRYNRFKIPNIQDVFHSKEIECLVMDYINFVEDKEYMKELQNFIAFVAYFGYKGEPELDGVGKPSSRCTTPVHHAVKQNRFPIRPLFKIYNRYDVNYTDESGLSHFHVACMYGFDEEIEKFLELGHDPNCIEQETGNSLLHAYLIIPGVLCWRMAESLMRKVADLNLANKDGLTPLHIISKKYKYDLSWILPPIPDVSKMLFDISDELNQPLQVDARDKFGNTPLHVAVVNENVIMTEMLLRRGGDPNLTNDEGSTPLHEFYKRNSLSVHIDAKSSVELFFKICDEVNQSVQVDARDKLGRTPLQLAVANLWPECIDILFERGADLSSFVFPTESYFAERYNKSSNRITSNDRLRLASSALTVVEKIENRGYQLKRSDALTIMKFFAEYKLFEKSSDLEKCWYDDEKFITTAKEMWICPGISTIRSYRNREKIKTSSRLTLDEVVRLRPEEAAKLLTYEDYWKFACSFQLTWQLKTTQQLSADHLCEKLSRGFFRSWALDPLWELIHKRLPLECCDIITEELKNEDLYHICLAAADQSS